MTISRVFSLVEKEEEGRGGQTFIRTLRETEICSDSMRTGVGSLTGTI